MTERVNSTHRVALYAGSFDPLTHGHEDLIRRALTLADRVVVAVAININKKPLFSTEERVELIRIAFAGESRVEVRTFTGLLVDFAREVGATINVRGVRSVSDFEIEMQMSLMNSQLHPGLETIFLAPSRDTTYISSSLVREVARFGGDVSTFVHPAVDAALTKRFKEQN